MQVGIENNNDDRSIAWALEYPGCFAYGANAAEAARNMQPAAVDYVSWLHQHQAPWPVSPPQDIRVAETFDAYFVPRQPSSAEAGKDRYLIESFFEYDRTPLTPADVERALQLLAWSRRDLLDTLQGLSPARLDQTYTAERWSINGILRHIAGAEWWYQERLGHPAPAEEDDLPANPLDSLALVRAHLASLLPSLVGLHQVVDRERELWSPRKLLRRTIWHERDHTAHIRKLL